MKKNDDALLEELKNLKLEKRRLLLLGKDTEAVDKNIQLIKCKIEDNK